MSKLVIDCGSTKLFYYYSEQINGKVLGDFNLINNNEVFSKIDELIKNLEIKEDYEVIIGLAGYSLYNPQMSKILLENEHVKSVEVVSDIELIAKSLLKDSETLVGVLGTGSVFAMKETDQVKLLGGRGTLLDEIGSGRYFGKLLVSQVLDDAELKLDTQLKKTIFNDYNLQDSRELIKLIYNKQNFLSSLSNKYFMHEHTVLIREKFIKSLNDLLTTYKQNLNISKIILLGSISKIEYVQNNLEDIEFIDEKKVLQGV